MPKRKRVLRTKLRRTVDRPDGGGGPPPSGNQTAGQPGVSLPEASNAKPRGWIFTYYDKGSRDAFERNLKKLYEEGKIVRYCFQEELCKTTKRWHLQGYLQLSSPQRSSYLSTHLWEACWYAPALSNVACIRYTHKSDTYISGTERIQVGDFATTRGHRSDLIDIQSRLDGGSSVVEISHSDFQFGANTDGPSLTTSSSEDSFPMPTYRETLSAPVLCCTDRQGQEKPIPRINSAECLAVVTYSRNPCVQADSSGLNGIRENLCASLMISVDGSPIALCLHCVTGMLQDWLSKEGLHGVVLDTSSSRPTNPLATGLDGSDSTSPLLIDGFQ